MQREDALGSGPPLIGRRFQELRYRRIEFERARFHLFAQLVPGREPVFAREPRLRLVQWDVRRLLKLFRLVFELVETGARGELLAWHKASMLSASGPQAGQHGDNRAGNWCGGWTQSFARTRVRPERGGKNAARRVRRQARGVTHA